MFRDSASIMAIVCSAVLMVLPAGVFITTTPARVAACLSMLSVPTPARAIALSRRFPSKTSAVSLTPLRQMAGVESAEHLTEFITGEARADLEFDAVSGLQEIETFLCQIVQNNDAVHGLRNADLGLRIADGNDGRRPVDNGNIKTANRRPRIARMREGGQLP